MRHGCGASSPRPPLIVEPRVLCSAHCASLCCFSASSQCCCPARTHRAGQAGRDALSLLLTHMRHGNESLMAKSRSSTQLPAEEAALRHTHATSAALATKQHIDMTTNRPRTHLGREEGDLLLSTPSAQQPHRLQPLSPAFSVSVKKSTCTPHITLKICLPAVLTAHCAA